MTLYASPYGGRRYHRWSTCTGLNSTEGAQAGYSAVPEVSRAEAVRRGLTPCGTCKPPPLLTAVRGGATPDA